MDVIKSYAIFSRESIAKLNGNRGKMCAQAGHAFLHSYWDAENHPNDDAFYTAVDYRNNDDARKITLIADTDEDLLRLVDSYRDICGTTVVIDCGYTIVEPDTLTCVGIGPLRDVDKGADLAALPCFE